MRILNLYAGIGGNRKLWGNEHEITAIEFDESITKIYKDFYPNDNVIVTDAHQYLLEHYKEFDFIWSSPPCQSHTRMIRGGRNRKPRYPDMRLYEEILFLKYNTKCKWVVENVKPYYEPFLNPIEIGRHLIWANFQIGEYKHDTVKNFINKCDVKGASELKKLYGLEYEGNIYYGDNHDPAQVLRNCVEPEIGKYIFDCILNENN